jgi:hypothetical protein
VIALWISLAWIILGAGLGWLTDRRNMREHVPYGDLPSVIPLKSIRTLMVLIAVLFGPFILLTAIYRVFAKRNAA